MESRYDRQLSVPGIGKEGMRKLAQSRVLLVGAGGLGSGLLFSLAGAGVGNICVMDSDVVSITNLNRQFLYTHADIGRPKAASAVERVRAFNPDIRLEAVCEWLSDINAANFVKGADAAVIAADNMETRMAVNRACVKAGVPLIDGAVESWYGRLAVVRPGVTPCLRCLYGEPEPSHTPPSLGAVVMAVAALEATLVIRVLLGLDTGPFRMLHFDAAAMTIDEIPVQRDPVCPICSGI